MADVTSKIRTGGIYIFDHYRNGEFLGRSTTHNIITLEGLKRSQDVMFHATTQTSPWYCGLGESNTAADAAMNYDVPVFTECTAYTEATRPEYVEAAATNAPVTTTNTANKATFTFNDTKTIYSAFLASVNTKGDHTAGANNVLYSYGLLSPARSVISGDVGYLTYALTSADDGV